MLLLSNIVNKLATREIPLGPELKVTVRALWAHEVDFIAGVYVRPGAPYGKNPLAGSTAPPIQREDDLAYLGKVRQWFSDMTTAECAVSIELGLSPTDGDEPVTFGKCPDGTKTAWLHAAVPAMRKAFLEPQIRLMHKTIEELGTKQLVREAMKIFVVESKEKHEADEDQIEIPANYDTTELGLLMGAARAFKVGDPMKWIDGLSPEERAAYIADELIFREREDRRMMILAQSARIAGV